MQRLLSQIGRSQRLSVVNLLKRSTGLTVRDLAARLDMSYMGVKQHCLDLEKDGYVDTFRRHRGVGRPELLYRLTNKAHDLFPKEDSALAISLLEQARKLFGSGSSEKILFLHFQEKTQNYASKIKGDTLAERAKWLVRLRDREGHMAELSSEPGLCIIERHHPMIILIEAFPEIAGMERDMFQRVLGVPVRRECTGQGGVYECTYLIG